MAKISSNRIAWTYTDDNGLDWRVAAEAGLVGQALQGGSAAAPTVPPRPNWGKMRRCTVSDAAGRSRTVVLYDKTAPLITAGTAINVNYQDDSHSLTSNGGFINEDKQGARVTKQST
jgi:hypothetical protein